VWKGVKFEPATAHTQNKDVENEEEERGEAAREQDISTKIRTLEQALHCINAVMQFAIESNSSSHLDLLYTVKDCIQKDMKQVSLLDLWKKSQ
jgi:cytochrome c-type biogenesis protein CcmH/NrfF